MSVGHDLVFVGNASLDQINTFEGPVQTLFGGGVAFSAMAAVWTGKRIAVLTRLAAPDDARLEPLRVAGIDVYATYTPQTTRHVVHHLSADVDQRQVLLTASAGPPGAEELDSIAAREGKKTLLHVAALTDAESSLGFLKEAVDRGFSVSVDLQGFVRQADPRTGEVLYGEVPAVREIVALVDRVKLDALEARFLTGLSAPEDAAAEMEAWGAKETMITWSQAVLVRSSGTTHVEKFFNTSAEGRTGRGDSTFGAYLACRPDGDVASALRWAAAVASMKLEKPGLFAGTEEQVRERLDAVRR